MDIDTVRVPKSGQAIADNRNALTRARHIVALSAGATAGVLQLESLHGLAVFVIAMAVVSLLLSGLSRRASKDSTLTGVPNALPGFILSWVLVYSLSA